MENAFEFPESSFEGTVVWAKVGRERWWPAAAKNRLGEPLVWRYSNRRFTTADPAIRRRRHRRSVKDFVDVVYLNRPKDADHWPHEVRFDNQNIKPYFRDVEKLRPCYVHQKGEVLRACRIAQDHIARYGTAQEKILRSDETFSRHFKHVAGTAVKIETGLSAQPLSRQDIMATRLRMRRAGTKAFKAKRVAWVDVGEGLWWPVTILTEREIEESSDISNDVIGSGTLRAVRYLHQPGFGANWRLVAGVKSMRKWLWGVEQGFISRLPAGRGGAVLQACEAAYTLIARHGTNLEKEFLENPTYKDLMDTMSEWHAQSTGTTVNAPELSVPVETLDEDVGPDEEDGDNTDSNAVLIDDEEEVEPEPVEEEDADADREGSDEDRSKSEDSDDEEDDEDSPPQFGETSPAVQEAASEPMGEVVPAEPRSGTTSPPTQGQPTPRTVAGSSLAHSLASSASPGEPPEVQGSPAQNLADCAAALIRILQSIQDRPLEVRQAELVQQQREAAEKENNLRVVEEGLRRTKAELGIIDQEVRAGEAEIDETRAANIVRVARNKTMRDELKRARILNSNQSLEVARMRRKLHQLKSELAKIRQEKQQE